MVREKPTQHSIPTEITSIDSPEREGAGTQQQENDQYPSLESLSLNNYFIAFDNFYRTKKGYPEHFMVLRNKTNTDAIKELIQAQVPHEQALFVLEDIWNDPDTFWEKKRTIPCVVSQFATRIVKMKQSPAPTKPSTISSNNQKNIEALLARSKQKVEA